MTFSRFCVGVVIVGLQFLAILFISAAFSVVYDDDLKGFICGIFINSIFSSISLTILLANAGLI